MKRKLIAMMMVLCLGMSMEGCAGQKISASNITTSKINVSAGENENVGKAETYIELGDNIKVNGNGVSVQENKITINSAGTYSISGDMGDGQIIIDAGKEEKVYLILNGVDVTCSDNAPIYVKQCDKAVISLAKDTENNISDGGEIYELDDDENGVDAAIFSKEDLILTGEGSLVVNSKYNDGITSKDDLRVENGNITVNSASNGIKGKDSFIMTGGKVTVNSGADGIKSTNSTDETKGYILIENGDISVNSQEDGIQAETDLYVRGGNITITTGGGSENNKESHAEMGDPGMGMGRPGMEGRMQEQISNSEEKTETGDISKKGLKAGNSIILEGGNFNIDSYDDSIHAVNINIVDGNYEIASGDDGIHADEEVVIDGGNINIIKSYEGIEGAVITINDGEIILVSSDDGLNGSASDNESEQEDPAIERNQGAAMEKGEGIGRIEGETAPGAEGQVVSGGKGHMGGGMELSGRAVVTINGGKLVVNADGDGLDSNGSMYMNGGLVIVNGPTNNGNGALDYDNEFKVSGGTLIAAGSSGMAQSIGQNSEQNGVKITFESQEAGKLVRIEDENGEEVITFSPDKIFSSIVVSSDLLKTGSTYKVYIGGSAQGNEYNGLYRDTQYTKGEEAAVFTISEITTNVTQEGVTITNERGSGMGQGHRDNSGIKTEGGRFMKEMQENNQ